MIPACPECHTTGVPLLFGLPVPEAHIAAANGDLALGGCLVPEEPPPNWQCTHRHRWLDADEKTWQDQLRAVLLTHGYFEPDGDA